MLDEQQLAVGGEHAGDLAQRKLGSIDRAQHERRDDGVDRAVGKRESFRGGVDDRYLWPQARCMALETCAHRRVWLSEHEPLELSWIVRQVQSGPAADLERETARACEQRGTTRARATALGEPHERVVDPGRDTTPWGRLGRVLWDLRCVLHSEDGTSQARVRHPLLRPSSRYGPSGPSVRSGRTCYLRSGRVAWPRRPPKPPTPAPASPGCSPCGGARCAG